MSAPTGGTFTLTDGVRTTRPIRHDASLSVIADEMTVSGVGPIKLRCEVLWHVYVEKERRCRSVWLSATFMGPGRPGRYYVKTDCGRETDDAAPNCVRCIASRP